MRSHVWMAAGLAVGVVLGLAAAVTQQPFLLAVARGLRPIGVVFLNLLSMVVIPLVATALFTGVAGIRDIRKGGRLRVRTPAFFLLPTFAALGVGLGPPQFLLPLGATGPGPPAAPP